jgi:hypothetical protein
MNGEVKMAFVSMEADTEELMAIIEDCLNNYASNVHLLQSPLTNWQIVKCRLPTGIASMPEQLAATLRTVLDELIDSLQLSDNLDLNSASARRYIIADQFYRQRLKQSAICPAHLPLSKSQFYRERTEVLATLANYVQHWEQRTIQFRKLVAIKTLTAVLPNRDSRLIGADSLLEQISNTLTNPDGPRLISLNGLGGLGKTVLAQEVVARFLSIDEFKAIGWINCQRDRLIGTRFETSSEPPLSMDSFFNDLLRQLASGSVPDGYLFESISSQSPDERVTFDQVLAFLREELEGREPSFLPLSEKRSLVIDLLWEIPTLIVVDGLEAVPEADSLIEELSQIASCTNMKVLITSRTRFSEHQYIRHYEITPASETDALQLIRAFAEELGIRAVYEAPPEELHWVAAAADGNPLVIKWIVNQLAAIPLRQVLSDLSQATGSARALYEFIYRRTWETLSDPAQNVLMAIAQSPDSEITWDSLLNSTNLSPAVLNRSLRELVTSLLIPISARLDPLYQISSITRAFTLAECRVSEV